MIRHFYKHGLLQFPQIDLHNLHLGIRSLKIAQNVAPM